MKDVQACLSARKAIEISFHHCGGHMKLMQAKQWCCGEQVQLLIA